MKKILTILGARPQFIKAAAVSRAISKADELQETLVHTGQHFDQNMSDIFFEEMAIPKPDYNLNINSLSHGAMTGQMLKGIEKIIQEKMPDIVLVYGDTNSTIAGALAAKKLNVKVGHVEAGLRSFNNKMPEEINRILTDRISDLLFCPTDTAVKNLEKEGFVNYECKIVKNGDVMYDAALFYSELSAEKSSIISDLKLTNEKFILCTIHRQENTDDLNCLNSIVRALNRINKEIRIVFPMHPRTRKIIEKENIQLDFEPIEPVGYFDIIELLKNCSLVMTDSGGLQKEAYFFKNHCVTLREQTEWIETVECGFNIIAGSDEERIYKGYQKMLTKQSDFNVNLYGNGDASEVIVHQLIENL
ncbi:MAG: UDP-N-acetylglucosamine 2-epimerase (non-hydrolyzing) [Flavobacteriales bacterium]|nr:MAG: UDP-N-acetylglucosamine 2-epimerase (non-hydrolyzing) [Flavobacteriales bacterium]